MLKKLLLIFAFLIISQIILAQNINIGLFERYQVSELVFESVRGHYIVVGDGKVFDLKKDSTLYLATDGAKVRVRTINKEFGSFKKVMLEKRRPTKFDKRFRKRKIDSVHIFRLQTANANIPGRFYDDELKIRVVGNYLSLVNDVEFDKYLAGVVEAEAGHKALPEFYKAQAAICRTYAIKNAHRHKGEYFQLCDGVDCQAFKGRSSKNDEILKAVIATHNIVITDADSSYINTVFSANCGGETTDSKDLWHTSTSYLKSHPDPYCVTELQAHWKRKISVSAWKNYLIKQGFKMPKNVTAKTFAFTQQHRHIFYEVNGKKIRFKQLRKDWRFRSAFFSVVPAGKNLLIKGRGYGHGVGMCQEGAMNMAVKGFTFDQIIFFYYKDSKIIKIENLF